MRDDTRRRSPVRQAQHGSGSHRDGTVDIFETLQARDQKLSAPRKRALQIYEELRERICLLDYKPGTILKERDLATEFGVSRTPIRRVLQWLESDGLILAKQGHGTVVTDIDLESQKDIYFLRTRLAEMIGPSGPLPPDQEGLDALHHLAERLRAIMDKPDLRAFGEINIGLHKQMQKVIRNLPLREVSDRLFYQTSRMWFKILPHADWRKEVMLLLQEIEAIEHCFRIGDVESAGFVRRNYVSMVIKRLQTQL